MMNFPMHTHNAAVIIVPTEWSRIRVQPEKKFFASKSRPQSTEERDYGIGCERLANRIIFFDRRFWANAPITSYVANRFCEQEMKPCEKKNGAKSLAHLNCVDEVSCSRRCTEQTKRREQKKKPDRRRASAVSHAIEVSAMNGLANATNSLICPRSAKEMKVSHKLDRGLKFLFFTRKTLHCVVGRRAVPQHTDNETTFRSRSHFFLSFASTSTGDNTQFFISFEFFRRRSFVVAIASVSLSCSLCVREGLRRTILFFVNTN